MIILKRSILAFIFLLGSISMLSSCFLTFRTPDKKAMKSFKAKNINAKFHQYKLGKRNIHYVESGNANANIVLLFIHGSPGSWNAFENYISDSVLNTKYLMASVDRPGYGYSDFGVKEESLRMQSIIYAPILKKYYDAGKKIVLIGHSYGGPVIAKMSMDFEDVISGLIFIAPSIDPALEKELWIQRPATWDVFKWMIPAAIIVSNEEILALKSELIKMMPDWKNIKVPIVFIQGGKDNLVHPANKDFAKNKLINAELMMMYYPELDHFIPFTHKEIVLEAIEKMQEKLR